jgi:hypothetical protein
MNITNTLEPMTKMNIENTLEPIEPITDTPYGALVIHNDILCAPTSLCTWSDSKPAVYCQLPPHTLNPVCLEVNKGIGLLGCYDDPSCGGLVLESKTEELLEKNPEYRTILKKQENNIKKQQKKKKFPVYAIIILSIVLVILLVLMMFIYKKRRITQIQRRSASRRILSGAGRTARPVNK